MLPSDFLFLDESGDLGLGERCTPIFVIGILHLRSAFALTRTIKRARRKALGEHAPPNELKWSSSSEKVRLAVLEQICREAPDIEGVSGAVVDKQWINRAHAQRAADTRYNFAVRLALEKGGICEPVLNGRRIRLTIDARNRRATETLTEYVELLREDETLHCDLSVIPGSSLHVPQLQAADFVVGAIYAAYAHGSWEYLNALKRAGVETSLRVLRRKPAP